METTLMQTTKVPTRKLSRLFHVGTLNAAHKGVQGPSQEGNGLSISRHPQEWTHIAKLGGGTTFTLTKSGGEFLDFHKLGAADREMLVSWGAQQGWSALKQCWKLMWLDSESGVSCHTLMEDTETAANAELEFLQESDAGARLESVSVPTLTTSAFERLGFKVSALSTMDMLATFWVEDVTALDGVWWDDALDPCALSAPRGVICKIRIPEWSIAPKQ